MKEKGKLRVAADAFLDGTPVAITVRKKEIAARQRVLDLTSLKYYRENPRVYSIVRSDGRDPSQEEIEETLLGMGHVQDLIHDIKRNGGIIDPLYVRDGTLEVIEGNSRLAALRHLFNAEPMKYGKVKCVVLPDDVDQLTIAALLAEWHLKGKKEWPPYEQAGFLYRCTESGTSVDLLALQVSMSRPVVQLAVEAYAFMLKHNDRKRDHWSYYEEYLKSRKIGRAREKYPSLDRLVVRHIKEDLFGKAQNLRDRLPVICEADKVCKKFVKEDVDIEKAYELAIESGGENTPYKRLKKFRTWLAEQDVQDGLEEADGKLRANILFEVKKIHSIIDRVRNRLE